MNKGAADEHLTRYLYTRSGEPRLVHEYIPTCLIDEEAQSTLDRQDSFKVAWNLDC